METQSSLAIVPQYNGIRTPIVPTVEMLTVIDKLADMASKSGMSKTKNPYDARFVMLYGWELGVSFMTSLRTIYSVNGGAPACSGELMLALIRRSGRVSVSISSNEDTLKNGKATVHMKRLDSGDEFIATWGKPDDERAGLKSNRDKYPAQMWTWRAVSIAAKALCSDIVGGLYTVEEIYPNTELDESGDPVGEIIAGELVRKPAPQTEPITEGVVIEDKPVVTLPVWLTGEKAHENKRLVIQKIMQELKLTPETIEAELKLLVGMDKPQELASWAQYPTGKEAIDAIKEADAKRIAAMKPATPKATPKYGETTGHTWTEDDIKALEAACTAWWDTDMNSALVADVVLAALEKIGWSEYKNPDLAIHAVTGYAMQRNLPMVVSKAKYHVEGNKKYAALSNGQLIARLYGRDELRKFGATWKTAMGEWKNDEIYELPEPIIVPWENKENYCQAKKEDIQLLASAEIPF